MFKQFNCLFIILILCQSCFNGTKTEQNNASVEASKPNVKMKSKTDSTLSDVDMKLIPDHFASSENKVAKYVITNNSSDHLNFGSNFWIERYQNNEWVTVPFIETLGFPDVMYGLSQGESREYPVHISVSIGDEHTKRGRYRLVKEIGTTNNDKDKVTLTAEFVID